MESRGTITLSPTGVRIGAPAMPDVLLPWDEIVEVSLSTYRVGPAEERCLAFDHVSGHVVEISQRSHGWDQALSDLGRYLALVVDDPVTVSRTITPDDEPAVIARAVSA